jgi:hypothetical protein
MTVLRYAQRVREPLVVSDATTDDRFARDPYFAELDCCSLLSVPILSRGTLQAVLLLENRFIRGAFSAERLDAVKLVAGQLAVSLDNAHLYAELADSRARLTKASDTERRRLERDLHDGAQQGLVAAMITLSLSRDQIEDRPMLEATLSQVEAELEQALQELRERGHGLYPPELTRSGLSAAIRAVGQRSGADVDIGEGVETRFAPEIEAALYYCCLEAIQNATKHAGPAAHTFVRVFTDTHALHLEVRDDGRGLTWTMCATAWASKTCATASAQSVVASPSFPSQATAPASPPRLRSPPHPSRLSEPHDQLATLRTALAQRAQRLGLNADRFATHVAKCRRLAHHERTNAGKCSTTRAARK